MLCVHPWLFLSSVALFSVVLFSVVLWFCGSVLCFPTGIPSAASARDTTLIARRASNITKWVLVVITVLGVIGTVPLLIAQGQSNLGYSLIVSLVFVLQLIAIAYLFRRDAAEWLKSRGQHGVVDLTAFN